MDLYLELYEYVKSTSRQAINFKMNLYSDMEDFHMFKLKLRDEFSKFADDLLSSKYSNCLIYKEIVLNESPIVKMFNDIDIRYLLSKIFYRDDMYYTFSRFVSGLIDGLSINRYKNMDLKVNEMVNKNFKFDTYNGDGRLMQLIVHKTRMNCAKYPEFDRLISSEHFIEDVNYIGFSTEHIFSSYFTKQDFLWIYFEYLMYKKLFFKQYGYEPRKEYLGRYYAIENIVRWVSRYDGDGYGLDDLSVALDFSSENAFEIKKSSSNNYFISDNEIRKIEEFTNYKNLNFYFCGYDTFEYPSFDGRYEPQATFKENIYLLDRDTLRLVNINNPKEYCEVSKNYYRAPSGKESKILIKKNL